MREIDKPGHEFRIPFDVGDEIEQLYRGVFQILARSVGHHIQSTG
jgi:hypothetical protein